MYKIKELKRIARGNLQGNYISLIRALIICDLIISLVQMPFTMMTNEDNFSNSNIICYVAIILINILSVVLVAGQQRMHLGLARVGKVNDGDLFVPARFYSNTFILTELILFACTLICLLPMAGGVAMVYFVKGTGYYIGAVLLAIISAGLLLLFQLNFNLVYFVLNDQEEMTMTKALLYTHEMMRGNKKKYLYLNLSFIGMYLLVLLTLGTGIVWVQPYMLQTTALFYLDVKGELPELLEKRKAEGISPQPAMIDHYV